MKKFQSLGWIVLGFGLLWNLNGETKMTEKIILGGGCFWCIEAVFENVHGVKNAVSGYSGGQTDNPTYEQICQGNTGHAEVVEVEYDSDQISLDTLLEIFFAAHDPTTLNRQGADVGTQYRSIIIYRTEEQKKSAETAIQKAQLHYKNKIVTEVVPLQKFTVAEVSHQDYYRLNGNAPYCRLVIAPKLKKLEKYFR